MKRVALLTVLALAGATGAHAADLRSIAALNQAEFRLLAQDLAAASAFKGLASAAPLGSTALEVSAAASFSELRSPAVWQKASFGRSIMTGTAAPSLRVTKGLPFGLDVGFSYGALDNAAANIAGAELRWSVLSESKVLPAVGVRFAASRVAGIDDLRMRSVSYDLIVSKGIGPVTPYLAFGRLETQATPAVGTGLAAESFGQTRVALGGHAKLGALDLSLEGDLTGKTRSGSTRLALRF